MTRQDYLLKWICYALVLVPAALLEFCVFARFPLWGITPLLLPVCALCVAALENQGGGVGFGLACGLLWSAAIPGDRGGMILALPLVCLLCSLLTRRALRPGLAGCLLCTLLGLGVWEVLMVLPRLLSRAASPGALLRLAVPELLLSALFLLPLYPLLHRVWRKVGDTRLAD